MGRLRAALAVTAALIALPPALLVLDGLTDEAGAADVAIVPGNKIELNGLPSPRLAARLDRAAELYRDRQVRAVIVSGGTGKEGFDEAKVMARYLEAHGVAPGAVLTDSQGVTTWATAVNATALMREHGFKTATVVTQYFHVPRTRLAMRRQGVETVRTAHARFFEARDLYSIAREIPGYASYLVRPAGA